MVGFLTQSESTATKEDHRNYCFQVQDVKDDDDEYIYFMGRWEKDGCKCGKQSLHLDICSLKEENYRRTIVGTSMKNVLGTSRMLIFIKQLLVCG